MDLTTLGEYGLKTALNVGLRLKKLYTSEVDDGIIAAFEFALNDWSKHTPTTSDKVRLSKALEGYIQSSTSYEALDPDTRAFIDCFKKRLSEQPAAHRYLMALRADMQEKSEEQNLLEHYRTQASVLDLKSRMEELNMAPQYIRALLKELPLEQGIECTELVLEEMLTNGRIHSEGAKRLVLEFVRFLFEHTDKISEETKLLREAGDSYLAETLEEIKRVLTGESEQSLTDVHKKYQEQAQQKEIRLLKELIEAAQIQFSFGEAREFYGRLIELAPTVEHHFNYAYLLQSLNDFENAKKHYEEALQALQGLAKQDSEICRLQEAKILNSLGVLLTETNDHKQAKAYYEKALCIYRELAELYPEICKFRETMVLNNLGILFKRTNNYKQAQVCYEEALNIRRELAKKKPEIYKPDVAESLNNLGNLFRETKKHGRSLTCHKEALKIYRELAKKNPEEYKPSIATALNNLGNLRSDINEHEQAQACYEEALQKRRELAGQNPEAYNPKVATTLNNLVSLYVGLKKIEDAEKAYQEAHDIYKDLASRHPRAYGIDYAKLLVRGFDLLGKPKEDLEEAKAILGKYPEHPKAQELLSRIEKLGKR